MAEALRCPTDVGTSRRHDLSRTGHIVSGVCLFASRIICRERSFAEHGSLQDETDGDHVMTT